MVVREFELSRFVRQLYSAVLFTVLILIVEGCLISQRTHEEKSRVRASIAFDELKAEEGEKSTAYSNKDNQRKNSGLIEVEKNKSLHVKQGKRPGWINKESEHYPSSMYLTGVGYSSDRQSAEDKARSEIAKIFYSNIHSRTSTLQEYLKTTSESKEKVTERFDIEEITRVSTRKVLSGVRIAQVFKQTKPDNVFYALAVLDRKQSAMILKYKIQELDIEIKRLIHNAEKEEDKLSKIKILKEVIQQYILREAYDAEFRIVNKSGKGISSDTDFNEIKNCLTVILLRDFLIFLSVKGDRAAEIHEALIEGLNKQGFSISENFNKASVVVRGNVEIRPVEFGTQEWKYVRWRVYFDLIDQKGGAIFGSVSKTGRAGHISLPQAEDRAVLKVKKILTVDIADDINRYIFSQQVK
ncbi:MAG: LPP20 family lipoprotein, partial [Deltaproteobacteria bacterium]|nr:LPP20 family lipoprotein [Deltaproteobacteria bacterium]